MDGFEVARVSEVEVETFLMNFLKKYGCIGLIFIYIYLDLEPGEVLYLLSILSELF